MKVSSAIKRMCKACKIVVRRRKTYVICENGKHKQRQGFSSLPDHGHSHICTQPITKLNFNMFSNGANSFTGFNLFKKW